MVILKYILLFIFLAFKSSVFGQTTSDDFRLICTPKVFCKEIKKKTKQLFKRNKKEQETFLRSLALRKGVRYLEIRKEKIGNRKITYILLERKPHISNINFSGPKEVDLERLFQISQLQEGVYFNEEELNESKLRMKSWLSERGFLFPNLEVDIVEKKIGKIKINIKVSYKDKVVLKKLIVEGESNKLSDELMRTLLKYEGKPFSSLSFKLSVDRVMSELRKEGYFESLVSTSETDEGQQRVVKVVVKLGERTQFSFSGNTVMDREELSLVLKKAFEEGVSVFRPEDMADAITKAYSKFGLYNIEVEHYGRSGLSTEGTKVRTNYFNIIEGKKSKLTKLTFVGNLKIDVQQLRNLYYSKASILASRDFVDESYLTSFSTILKNHYLKNGFVFIDISKPRLSFDKKGLLAEVVYSIKERQQCFIEKINLDGIPENEKPNILNKITNKVGAPLNVIELENDLSRALEQLREAGFFYATISNLNKSNVVSYESNYTKSQINLVFKPGRKALFETAVLSGNRVTKDKVLLREMRLVKGDLITPEKIKRIRDRINSLGIFGRVQVIPMVVNKLSDEDYNKTNLIIQVQEKKFGRGEIAPGYRTDVGAKVSLTLTKSNITGMNDAGTLKFQVNRRFSLRQFDARRKASRKHRIEGISRFSYSYPYLLNIADFTSNVSIQRRRFFAFDADIYRISPQLTKQIIDQPGRRVGASLKYQYERIRQFDASLLRDRATFEIGSITPGVTLDFRDSPVSPRSGAYFGLSWEFANPGFGSQKDNDIEINFSKVISRNRFYIPLFSKTFVLAVSLAVGMQKNYANEIVSDASSALRTRGYIPSIKVFRLDGFDLVRGFADAEINKLENGNDISEQRIDGKAFFTNLKFEPRYFMSDSIVLGAFFDAGRIQINKFRPLDLRTAAGLTFKFLTPVGTLDFDYGVKLRRVRVGPEERESFGRFHLSIGYF